MSYPHGLNGLEFIHIFAGVVLRLPTGYTRVFAQFVDSIVDNFLKNSYPHRRGETKKADFRLSESFSQTKKWGS